MERMRNSYDLVEMKVKGKIASSVGIDQAIELMSRDYSIDPIRMIVRAVSSGLLSLDEINKDLVNNAEYVAESVTNIYKDSGEGIGSSDMTYFTKEMLDGAGYKTDFINNRLTRVDEYFADGGMMADGGAIKGSNPSTGEKFGVVVGSLQKEDGLTTLTIRSSYSTRINSYELRFDEKGFLSAIGDFGYSMDGTYPDMNQGSLSVRNVNADNKKETIDAIANITSPSFAKKVYDYVQGEKMAKGGDINQEYVVYVNNDQNIVGTYNSKRSAKMAMDKLWETNQYESVGMGLKSEAYSNEYFAEGGYMADGGETEDFFANGGSIKDIKIGSKIGFLSPNTGRYEYAEVLSMDDEKYFLSLYPSATQQFIAPFHPYDSVNSLTGSGNYCLYHGNLSHPENIEACLFLLNNVFNQIEVPFIVAGKNPSDSIIAGCKRLNHCQLIANPSTDEMNRLIANAHIHTMPTFQQSGMKLKLLYALFCGRHIITTPQMLAGTGLNDLCTIATDAGDYISAINNLMQTDFSKADFGKRDIALRQYYTNTANAQKIVTWMRQ
jgi:hypothetical protein